MSKDTVKAYEIYVKNAMTGESGWDIRLVYSTAEHITSYPNFDCVITVNDCWPDEEWYGVEQ